MLALHKYAILTAIVYLKYAINLEYDIQGHNVNEVAAMLSLKNSATRIQTHVPASQRPPSVPTPLARPSHPRHSA